MAQSGSEKLLRQMFGAEGAVTKDSLAEAVGVAREGGYKIVRWWWKGQPAIDQIQAVFEVPLDQIGGTVKELASLHGDERTIGLEVFPYGIPVIDGVRLAVDAKMNLRR